MFDAKVARRWVRQGTRVVIGYPNACLRMFEKIKHLGGTAILDLPIGHYLAAERLFEEERKQVPLFADSITFAEFDERYRYRLNREIEFSSSLQPFLLHSLEKKCLLSHWTLSVIVSVEISALMQLLSPSIR